MPVLLAGCALGLAGAANAQEPELFVTADRCIACHQGVVAPSGEDVSIGFQWRPSMMANASRDPYWQAAVRREVLDHPTAADAIQGECSTCHMPMAHTVAKAAGSQGTVFGHLPIGSPSGADAALARLAADGVSCSLCHQIGPEGLGTRESLVGGFAIDGDTPPGERRIFGPLEVDGGRARVMHSATGYRPTRAPHVGSSELCATCHTLYTHALNDQGEVVGELPEQVPYLEWRHSAYHETRGCPACHMPVVEDSVAVAGVLGVPRTEVSRHVFRGGNFFMLRMLNRYRDELGVSALNQELAATADGTEAHLGSHAASVAVERVEVAGGRLQAELSIASRAGHKLPTAYPSRRAWLHVAVEGADGATLFESGGFLRDGRIGGNDNDEDPSRFEPHYERITHPEQVQIYEAILADSHGAVTTGLIAAVRYLKDNRLLPAGFDKQTADPDISVKGTAVDDPDFMAGGDRVLYDISLGSAEGPYRLIAELWYQPIAFRWARNLSQYDAPETRRFAGFYDSMAASSAVVLARDAVTVR